MGKIDVSVDMYYAMAAIAYKYKISLGEVRTTLIRSTLERDFGFSCDHPEERIIVSKKHRYYCAGCWRFMRKMRRLRPKSNEPFYYFTPKKTFLEEIKEQENPMAGLRPDQRGGE